MGFEIEYRGVSSMGDLECELDEETNFCRDIRNMKNLFVMSVISMVVCNLLFFGSNFYYAFIKP